MHKPDGANVGKGSCLNGSCWVVQISCRRGRAVADGGAQHPCIWQRCDGSWGHPGSSAAPTLGAVALGGRVRLTMARNFCIDLLRLVALMAVVGVVLCNVRQTLHAARTVRSLVEIVGIMQWLGYSHHASAAQQQQVVGMCVFTCSPVVRVFATMGYQPTGQCSPPT
jgi:hypothetical protein